MYSRDPQWRIALPMHGAMEHRGNDALTRDQRAACSNGGRFRTTRACGGCVRRARRPGRDLRAERGGDVRELWQREHFVDGLVIQHALKALDAIGRMSQVWRELVLCIGSDHTRHAERRRRGRRGERAHAPGTMDGRGSPGW